MTDHKKMKTDYVLAKPMSLLYIFRFNVTMKYADLLAQLIFTGSDLFMSAIHHCRRI